MTNCVCPPRVESLFTPVLWHLSAQAPLAFRAKCSVGSFSKCQTLRLGNLTWCSVLSLLWGEPLRFSYLPVCGLPTQQVWDCFYHESTPPSVSMWLLLCVWVEGIFFGSFQSIFLMVVKQIFVIFMFSWEEMSPSLVLHHLICIFCIYLIKEKLGRIPYFSSFLGRHQGLNSSCGPIWFKWGCHGAI